METSIEFNVPVGKLGTPGKVDDALEEGVTRGNHPACKLESAYKGLKFSEGGWFFNGPLMEGLFGTSELVLWEAGLHRMGVKEDTHEFQGVEGGKVLPGAMGCLAQWTGGGHGRGPLLIVTGVGLLRWKYHRERE